MTEKMTPVQHADAVLADLRGKHAAAISRRGEIAEERQRIAFAAHSGDAGARMRLDTLHQECAVHESEIASLDAAVAEAERRQASARVDAEAERARERARQARDIAGRLRGHGQSLSDAAARLRASYAAMREEMRALARLGYERPAVNVDILSARALQAELLTSGLQTMTLAPAERRTFAELTGFWSQSIEALTADVLGDDAPAAEQGEAA